MAYVGLVRRRGFLWAVLGDTDVTRLQEVDAAA
jgi:hypothetical protein